MGLGQRDQKVVNDIHSSSAKRSPREIFVAKKTELDDTADFLDIEGPEHSCRLIFPPAIRHEKGGNLQVEMED